MSDALGTLLFGAFWVLVVASGLALLVVAVVSGPWYAAIGGLVVLGVAAVPAFVFYDEWRG